MPSVISRHPCLLLAAYTVTVVVGVIALVATEGPWVRDGEMPQRGIECLTFSVSPLTAGDPRAEADRMRHIAASLALEFTGEVDGKRATRLEQTRSDALRCAESFDALAVWHAGHFNGRDARSIGLWLALLLVPAWVFCARRRTSSSTLTVEQVQALAKRLPR